MAPVSPPTGRPIDQTTVEIYQMLRDGFDTGSIVAAMAHSGLPRHLIDQRIRRGRERIRAEEAKRNLAATGEE